jgi:hypothetical protein
MENEDKSILVPDPSIDSSDSNEVSLVKLVEELESEFLSRSTRYLARAQYNERMVSGDQDISMDREYNLVSNHDYAEEGDFITRNLLANLKLTWSSRILEERPNITCYPVHPGADINSAENSLKILEYKKQQQDFDDMCFQAAELVQPHSCVGWKIVWDPMAGPPSPGVPQYDELTGQPMFDENNQPVLEGIGEPLGDVVWQLESVFDYMTDGAEHIEDSEWVIFVKHIDKYAATKLLRAAGIDEPVSTVPYTDIWGVGKTGVKIYELWWRPGYRFPDGLYGVMVGGHSVSASPFPYSHKELPLGVWKCSHRRNSAFGTTHVDNAVQIQKQINIHVQALARQAIEVRDIMFVAPQAIIDKMIQGNHRLPCDDEKIINGIRYIEPPDLAKPLMSALEDNFRAIHDIYGLNELLTGSDNIKSGTAAKSIAYLNKLDSMKLSGAARSLSKMILRVMRQTLKLYQQYASAPRVAQILGEGIVEAMEWTKADIAGVDVLLEPASGHTLYRADTIADAQGKMQQMGPTPELVAQENTGLKQTSFDNVNRDLIQAQIQAVVKGQPMAPDPSIDANVAMDEIIKVLGQYQGSPAYEPLRQLLMTYMQGMQQNAQTQEPQQ